MNPKKNASARLKSSLLDEAWDLLKKGKINDALRALGALNELTQISSSNQDDSWLFVYSKCLYAKERYTEALKMLETIKQKTLPMQLHEIDCYKALKDYGSIIQAYHCMENWEQNPEIRIAIGFAYEKLHRYLNAIAEFETSYQLKRSINAVCCLIHVYQKTGRFESVLELYEKLPRKEKTDKKVLLSVAFSNRKLGLFSKAVSYYKQCRNWEQDNEMLLGLGFCYIEMNDYEQAIECFKSINEWRKDTNARMGLGSCYNAQGLHVDACEIFKTILQENADNTPSILIKLAHCYEALRDSSQALYYYRRAKNDFPTDEEAHYNYCQYAIANDLPDAKKALTDALHRWPYMAKLYVLKAKYETQANRLKQAHATLMYITHEFPYYANGYSALVQHYLAIGEDHEAEAYRRLCLKKFPKNELLSKKLNRLFNDKRLKQRFGHAYTLEHTETSKIILSPIIKEVFDLLHGLPGERYLVGSALHALLHNKPLLPEQDIDLVVTTSDLEPRGFIRSPFKPQLFSLKTDRWLVDCYVVPSSDDNLIASDAFSRDFTITCLYCNSQGVIYDPTDRGLTDFKNKQLQTVKHPKICFDEDPVRLLRAIKYIILGYTPTPELEQEIHDWQVCQSLDRPHFYAVIRKNLFGVNHETSQAFFEKLITYGILKKVFNLDSNIPDANTLEQLIQTISVRHSATSSSVCCASFFKPALEVENTLAVAPCNTVSALASPDEEPEENIFLPVEAPVKHKIDPKRILFLKNLFENTTNLANFYMLNSEYMSAWHAFSSFISLCCAVFSKQSDLQKDQELYDAYIETRFNRLDIAMMLAYQVSQVAKELEVILLQPIIISDPKTKEIIRVNSSLTLDLFLKESKADFDSTIEVPELLKDVGSCQWCCNYACLLLTLNQYNDAEKTLGMAVRIDNASPIAHFWLGSLYKLKAKQYKLSPEGGVKYTQHVKKQRQELFSKSQEEFRQVLSLCVNDNALFWKVHYSLAEIAILLACKDRMKSHVRAFLENAPIPKIMTLLILVNLQHDQGDFRGITELYEVFCQVHEQKPDRFDAVIQQRLRSYTAMAYKTIGQFDKAEILEQANTTKDQGVASPSETESQSTTPKLT